MNFFEKKIDIELDGEYLSSPGEKTFPVMAEFYRRLDMAILEFAKEFDLSYESPIPYKNFDERQLDLFRYASELEKAS